MSHHLDSPTAREDGRVDLCDLFVFPGTTPQTTVFIMTVNPDAGLSSPTTFRSDALYEFKIDTNGDAQEDVSYRISFGEPDPHGVQSLELRRANGLDAVAGVEGVGVATGHTEQPIVIAGGGRLWAGLAGDPFFADAGALAQFLRTLLGEQRFDTSVFGASPTNFSAGRNVSGIVIELPTATLGAGTIHVWAATAIWKDHVQVPINRTGVPLIQPVFNSIDPHLNDAYNRTHPKDDVANYGGSVIGVVAAATRLGRSAAEPEVYAQHVVNTLLPDMLRYELGTPAHYGRATRNGRRLTDDVFDATLSLVTNIVINDGIASDDRQRAEFPYLALPHITPADMQPILVHDPDGHTRYAQ